MRQRTFEVSLKHPKHGAIEEFYGRSRKRRHACKAAKVACRCYYGPGWTVVGVRRVDMPERRSWKWTVRRLREARLSSRMWSCLRSYSK